jgi:hypothetical protein
VTSRLLRGLQRWRRLPAGERSVTLAVAGLVPLVSCSLWLIGFPRTVWWLERSARVAAGAGPGGALVIRQGTAAVARVRRYTPWTGRCLARALSLWWVLRRRGVPASVSLGVRYASDLLEAHAWVVHKGDVLADSRLIGEQYPGQFHSEPGTLCFSPSRGGARD